MSKHTPEPWSIGTSRITSLNICAIDSDGSEAIVASPNFNFSNHHENAVRIVTCVNACAGISTAALESMPINSSYLAVVDERDQLRRQRDELLDALGAAIPLVKQARLDWCDQNAESYDEDVVTPYDAILYRPILSLLETKGSAS